MVNEKCYTRQNNLGRKFHADFLKPAHKVWSMDLREVCKMINDVAHHKALCFRQDAFVAIINLFKSCLAKESFDDLERIEWMFPSKVTSSKSTVASWITTHIQSLMTDTPKKHKLLLKAHFAHWLSTASGDNILKLHKSITGKFTVLGHRGMHI